MSAAHSEWETRNLEQVCLKLFNGCLHGSREVLPVDDVCTKAVLWRHASPPWSACKFQEDLMDMLGLGLCFGPQHGPQHGPHGPLLGALHSSAPAVPPQAPHPLALLDRRKKQKRQKPFVDAFTQTPRAPRMRDDEADEARCFRNAFAVCSYKFTKSGESLRNLSQRCSDRGCTSFAFQDFANQTSRYWHLTEGLSSVACAVNIELC